MWKLRKRLFNLSKIYDFLKKYVFNKTDFVTELTHFIVHCSAYLLGAFLVGLGVQLWLGNVITTVPTDEFKKFPNWLFIYAFISLTGMMNLVQICWFIVPISFRFVQKKTNFFLWVISFTAISIIYSTILFAIFGSGALNLAISSLTPIAFVASTVTWVMFWKCGKLSVYLRKR